MDSVSERGQNDMSLQDCWAAVKPLALEVFHKQDRVSSL